MKNNKKIITLGAVCLLFAPAWADGTRSVSVTTPQGRTVTVKAVTDNIIKVENTAPGEKTEPSKTTLAANLEAEAKGDVRIEREEGYTLLRTAPGVVARVDNKTGAVTIDGGNGRMIHDSGLRRRDARGRRTLSLLSGETASYYGGGERGFSYNLAGDTLVMYNRQNYGYTDGDPRIRQMNITMPLVVSPKGFAVVMDDYAEGELVTGSPLEYASVSPDALSYYFVNSPEGFGGITRELTALTGRQEIAPLWSLGYITSKYGYKTQSETDSVVNVLKRDGYPLDGIVLDLYWYGKEQDMGRLAWDPVQWPEHKKMLAGLRKKGVNLTAISQPYVLVNGKGIENYRELASRGMFGKDSVGGVKEVKIWVGEGGMLDVSNPDTRAWLRERYRQLTDEGMGGWWGDLGEPEVHPDGMHHANGLTTRQYHNLYGNDWSRIISDLYREEYPDRRLMTLMRGGTVGLQRYNVFPWSTDVSRSWGGLQPQVKIMLNSGLSGLGYMSHDVGGFAIDPENPIDPELYVRWLQLGLFSPVLRTHSQQYAEPYHYPAQQKVIKELILDRYRWLPYNYTLAYENATEGLPLVRPLGMYEADPSVFDDVTDQYLWGRDVMVAPVMTQGTVSRSLRFPSGKWIDMDDPSKVYEGGTVATVDAPLEAIPHFARAGALIPKADYRMENTGGYRRDRYTVEYYPTDGCGESSFTLFEDDGMTARTTVRGEYALIRLTADNTPEAITLTARAEGTYPGMPAKKTLTYVIRNCARPASVSGASSRYDARTRTLRLTATLDGASPLEIRVTK